MDLDSRRRTRSMGINGTPTLPRKFIRICLERCDAKNITSRESHAENNSAGGQSLAEQTDIAINQEPTTNRKFTHRRFTGIAANQR